MSALRSDIWCGVFVRRHNDLGNMCVVARRGDPIAGQVFIEVDHLDGTRSLFTPAPMAGRPDDARLVFQRRFSRVEAAKVSERIAREIEFDPDLWVLSLDLRGDDVGIDLA
ncbi:MAG: DUF1491 family protein [Devosia sp.]|uniref:DUF1491 family protein n=1 Tax=Devosia sp. XGJD_8 TaxID=3391187 RepID=UPI001DEF862D|nr:DUF1491 family protein [Alphaproteobacteria bacterium]MBU1563369.1 DUF1491 family protein [Alphaproteobacteria bacterium]MBU2301142.1 DUF1491 family protein [Alphaproteobacteria bacterium]MBU2366837.1 DUF1491 family protein [Alphaproteobacteria bacterium]